MTWRKVFYDHRDYFIIYITPILLLPLPLLVTDQKGSCGYMLLLMGVYWCTECLPLGVTGLIPVFLAPLFGILTTVEVCENYLKDNTMMFTGGLFVAIALEKCRLHKRIAISILRLVGTEPKWLMFGFMLPTWFLSMWISNTATTSMMLPILEAVLGQLKETYGISSHSVGTTNLAFEESDNKNNNILSNKTAIEDSLAYSGGTELLKITRTDHTVKKDNELSTDNGYAVNKESISETNRAEVNKSELFNDNGYAVNKESINEANRAEVNKSEDIILKVDEGDDDETPEFKHLCRGMTLAVAYAANVGGTATLTGTGPNTILKGHADEIWYERGLGESPVTYASWLIYGFPQAVVNLLFVYFWLRLFYLGFRSFTCKSTVTAEQSRAVKSVINAEHTKLGPIRYEEWAVGFLFTALVLLWFFRSPGFISGWGNLFKEGYIGDAVPAIFIATLMFCIPNRVPSPNKVIDTGRADALLDWPIVHTKYPWSIIFLMGGGFALAEACESSGLSEWIGEQLAVFGNLPGWLMVAIICFLVAMLTEVTSNSATCTILMPIVAAMAETLGMNPLYLMMPTAIATSFAFMLPVATPPNAIAFSYGRIAVIDMIKAGAMLNFLCIITVTLATHTWAYDYFEYGTIPWDTNVVNTTQSPVVVTC